MTFPEPACSYGYTEDQLAQVLRADLVAYRARISDETPITCIGTPQCPAAHGVVHDVQAVQLFQSAPAHERRESMIEILASWDLDGALPDEQGMQVVRGYVAGDITLAEALSKMSAMFRPHDATES
jgi:hypothetical protein